MLRQRVLVLLALGALSASAGAAETELEMERIVVTATRTAIPILASPDHVTVIDGNDVAAAGSTTVADALRQVAGVEIADSGTVGSVKSASIRGSVAAQVLVLVDGVRLNDSRQGGADLSLLPVENIERIEVLRGGTSALYGADALGGVINVITKSRAEKTLTLTVSNGGYFPHDAIQVSEGTTETPVGASIPDLVDTQRLGLQAFGALGPVDLLVTGSFIRAANGFVWNDQQYIDAYRRQINSALLGGNASLSLEAPAGAGRLGFKGQMDYSSVGVPGSLGMPSTDAAQQRAAFQTQIFYKNPQLTRALGMDARAFYKLTRLAYQDPDPFFPADDVHTLHSIGLELQQQASFIDFLQLVYGGNVLADLAESTAIGEKQRLSGGVFLEAPLYLASWMILTPMVRYDLYSDFPGSLTYKLAGVLTLSDRVSLKASAGRSYRAPTLNDLYWPNDVWSEGNPGLRPETGYSGDLGVSLVAERLQANAFAFVRRVQDGIQWAETSPFFYQPMNVGEALFPGAEVDVDFQPIQGLYLRGSYTFQHSFVLKGASASYTFADDKRAIYTPVHSAGAAVRYDNGRTRLGVDAKLVGERFIDEANSTSLPAYVTVNAEARQQLTQALALSLAGKNLLNQVYQTVNGYVMPPLSFVVGIDLSL
jgi:outer membrane receptor for ferrienterochelin and colicins